MVYYNSSRTYHGSDFGQIDLDAKISYSTGAQSLPSENCKTLFKYSICQNYFRSCDLIGNSRLPCNTLCNLMNARSCSEFNYDCNGPEYGLPGACYAVPLPDLEFTCDVPKRNSGRIITLFY